MKKEHKYKSSYMRNIAALFDLELTKNNAEYFKRVTTKVIDLIDSRNHSIKTLKSLNKYLLSMKKFMKSQDYKNLPSEEGKVFIQSCVLAIVEESVKTILDFSSNADQNKAYVEIHLKGDNCAD